MSGLPMGKKTLQRLLMIGGLVFAGTVFVLPAHAIQDVPANPDKAAEQPEEPNPANSPAGLVFRWLNFVIVFGLAGYFIVKKGGPSFRESAKEISAGIASATAAKATADADLRKAEAGLARLPQDSAAMRETATKEFAMESERLQAAAQQEIARIETAAAAEINASRRAARIELRGTAARLASTRAAEIVPGQITPAQRNALVKKFVDELPETSETRGVN